MISYETYLNLIHQLDDLVAIFEKHQDPVVREQVMALLSGIDMLHREGLSRFVDALRASGGGEIVGAAAEDPVVKTFLGLYDVVDLKLPPEDNAPAASTDLFPIERLTGLKPHRPRRVLIAGFGNVLRGDDGFGPVVIQALEDRGALPEFVQTLELGTGGIVLVQELMKGFDALVIVDAVDRGRSPGSVYVLEPEVPDPETLSLDERAEISSDLHQAVPERALIVAKAAGVLPPVVRIIGCQPERTEELTEELSASVAMAVPEAVENILAFLRSYTGVEV